MNCISLVQAPVPKNIDYEDLPWVQTDEARDNNGTYSSSSSSTYSLIVIILDPIKTSQTANKDTSRQMDAIFC
jgi:hypothetical protein